MILSVVAAVVLGSEMSVGLVLYRRALAARLLSSAYLRRRVAASSMGFENEQGSDTIGSTLHDRVGGGPFFVALVDRFYEEVAVDPVLRPLYPDDLEPGKAHLAAFLAQYWGGPPYYTMERGHPRLRRRHFPFPIGQVERDAWALHMRTAVTAQALDPSDAALLVGYFEETATFLMNRP
jgi:hemoglobin